jgi:hypothetical protein
VQVNRDLDKKGLFVYVENPSQSYPPSLEMDGLGQVSFS